MSPEEVGDQAVHQIGVLPIGPVPGAVYQFEARTGHCVGGCSRVLRVDPDVAAALNEEGGT